MRVLFFLSVVICGFFHLKVSAQKNYIENKYTQYFENTREIPHLHLNKTVFIRGEEIWFQAYVLEQSSKKPHPTTSNLYVSIFDSYGKLKDQKLIHIKAGRGYGSIFLDSTFVQDHYYLKASTKWMKNFNEPNSFSQKITLLTSEKKIKTSTKSEDHFFEFRIFPESGHFVEGVENTVGILIKDKNNVGQKIVKGTLKEASGKVIDEFTTNIMGLGSLDFFYEKRKSYEVEVLLENGSIITKKLPVAKQKGIAMHIENPNAQYIRIRLLTNEATLGTIEHKEFSIWIHNTNTYYQNTVSFKKEENAKILFIKNSKLARGMNIITLFDENNTPISERLFFNYDPDLFTKPNVTSLTVRGDSLSTTITNTSNKTLYLSASFLPESTKAYMPTSSMYMSVLFKPYIKGDIQNPDYYFKEINRKKLKDLDLLLLTQGWSKYQWNNIFNHPPETQFEFENGIDLSIRFNKPIHKKESVLMYSEDNNLIRQIRNQENPYILKNTFIKKSSKLDFALKDNNDLLKITPIISYSNSALFDTYNGPYAKALEISELEVSNFKQLSSDTELLDEIVLKSAKKEYKNKVRGAATMLRRVDAKELIVPTQYLFDYIEDMIQMYRYSSKPLTGFFLNSEDVTRQIWLLNGITMDQVREVAYGLTIGGQRQLHIFTYTFDEYNHKAAKFTQIQLPVGFATEKEYYSPKYPSFLNDTYKKYGAIYWKPNITIAPKESIEIRSPKNFQEAINIYIEGVTIDGKLTSYKYTVQ